MHFPMDALAGPSAYPADFWLFDRPVDFAITSKLSDLPAWFTLHPSEMQEEVARTMNEKLKGVKAFPDAVQAPNAWRVKEGDRIAFFCERPWTNPTENGWIIDISENALAYWQVPGGRLPELLDAFGASPSDDDERRKRWMRDAATKVASMGMPRSCSFDWGIPRM